MLRIGIFIAIVLISTGKPAVAEPQPRERANASAGSRPAPAVGLFIRIAVSKDGFSFTETGEILVKNADSPDIVRLPNDDLLAVFRCQTQPGAAPVLAAVRSVDDGRSWSSLRPLVFKGGGVDSGSVRNPSLALMPSGMVRLYFALAASQDGAARLGSAVTRDGLTYQADPQVRVRCERADAVDPLAFWAGRDLRLLAVSTEATTRRAPSRPPAVWVFSSGDGRHFKATGLMREPVTPADVLGERSGYRMYVCDRGLIRCMVSPDAARWRLHPATCLRGGSDPAVVQLRDNSYLMLYCAPPDERSARQPEKVLASAGSSGDQQAAVLQQADRGQAGDQPTGNAAPDSSQQAPSKEPAWEAFTEADAAAEVGSDTASPADSAEASTADLPDEFAPLPDFQNPFDYVSWYSDASVPAPGENAYESYAQFPIEREGPEWEVMDVLDKGGFRFSEPWDPAAHPDWDAAFQAADDLLARYREATRDTRPYASPVQFMVDGKLVEKPNGPSLLFNMALPTLAGSRYLAKTTLADAWRLENGQLNTEKMKHAWTTVLGNVEHLRQGASTIEKLVSVAERGLVEEDARSALAKGVFKSADEIEAALQTLQERDLPDPDPASFMRFECAAMLDAIQYAFSPTGDGSAIVSNPEKAKQIANFFGSEQMSDEDLKQAAAIDTKTVNEAVDLLNSHFRESVELVEKGYPALRAADFAKKEEQRALSNPVTKPIMPSLARVCSLQTRSEASRRATQLSYAVQLFRARNGRWPASFDELPVEHRDSVRTDPFTGEDFRYRIDGGGFTIYSAAENGVDDGGIHNPDQRKIKDSSSDDFVFWPPQ